MNSTNVLYWFVYLHGKGNFIPGYGNKFGSTFFVTSPTDAYPQGGFQVFAMSLTDATYLDEIGAARCNVTSTDLDMGSCIDRYAKKTLGCTLPWDNRDIKSIFSSLNYRVYANMNAFHKTFSSV